MEGIGESTKYSDRGDPERARSQLYCDIHICMCININFIPYSISLLLDALQEAEDQRRKGNSVHADVIDRSFDTHEARLKAADAFFRRRVDTLFVDRTNELDEAHFNHNKDEVNIRKINALANYQIQNKLNAAKSTAISKIQHLRMHYVK